MIEYFYLNDEENKKDVQDILNMVTQTKILDYLLINYYHLVERCTTFTFTL